MALQVGSRLGHYDVTALIGEGGHGRGLPGHRHQALDAVARLLGRPQWAVSCDAVTTFEKTLSAADRKALERMILLPPSSVVTPLQVLG